MKTKSLRAAPSLVVGWLLAAGVPMTAEIHYVTVDALGFSPALLAIELGDTVVWTNMDEGYRHTTTSTLPISDPNHWHGYLEGLGGTFARTFLQAGTFPYIDLLGIGTGTITVNAAATVPEIRLEFLRLAGGQFLFDATGLTMGKMNVVWTSTNLTNWLPASTNSASSASITITNPVAPGRQFFRVVELP